MDSDAVYFPDDEALIPPEDLSAFSEGASAAVAELCAHGPSAAFLLGCALLAAAALIVAIRLAWAIYEDDITAFYLEVADAAGRGPLQHLLGEQSCESCSDEGVPCGPPAPRVAESTVDGAGVLEPASCGDAPEETMPSAATHRPPGIGLSDAHLVQRPVLARTAGQASPQAADAQGAMTQRRQFLVPSGSEHR
mmetsp:Transcript_64108/g.178174  ORF Transcript_64108/g.178174 Transcript_64108/m.178174 type:complete len:194 (+) Transcript_64108:85-666(+)